MTGSEASRDGENPRHLVKWEKDENIILWLFGVSLCPSLALASPETMPLTGVWTGSIGTQAIMACFNAGKNRKHTGNCYYQNDLQ
jgi:hypothetical protein